MRASDRAENCCNRRRQQDDVSAEKTSQDDAGILRRFRHNLVRAIGSTTNTRAMKTAQINAMASSHQNGGSPNWLQRSSRQAIQSPVAPARGIDHRLHERSAFQLLRIALSPARGSSRAFARGNATSVMNATPPIQCVTKRTCNARASSMSSSWLMHKRSGPGGYAQVYPARARQTHESARHNGVGRGCDRILWASVPNGQHCVSVLNPGAAGRSYFFSAAPGCTTPTIGPSGSSSSSRLSSGA